MKKAPDFNVAPLLVIWETTRSCALACRHCRAAAIDRRDPGELTLAEGWHLIDEVARMGTPLMVLTGGDPLQREDLELLISHGKEAGLTMATIPAATARLTHDRIRRLKAAGVDQMALSLDGSTAERHDTFRGVPGTFDKTMQAAAWAREEGVPLQINTVFTASNFDDYDALAALVENLGVVFWEVFFLVPTGRGSVLRSCSADQFEHLFEKLQHLQQRVRFHIKVTEAPHYRRYVAEHTQPEAGGDRPRRSAGSVNSGKGFCFVDHVGQVCPSGFLPIPCGNVRDTSISEIYRENDLFRKLRNTSRLKGRCGRCKYRDLCGGSRARAWAVTGDYLAEEPCCVYLPQG